MHRIWLLAILALWSVHFSFAQAPESAAGSTPPDTAAAEAPRELTLAQAAALTLQNSPELASFRWKIRSAEARTLQASLRPNPELSLEIEDLRWKEGPGTHGVTRSWGAGAGGFSAGREHTRESGAKAGFAESQFTLRLAQVIELGGKRVKRFHMARREQDLAQWDYEAARLNVMTKTTHDFIATLSAQRRLELASGMVQVAGAAAEAVAARVEAGKVSPLESNKAQTELDSARIAETESRHVLSAARASLAANWGASAPDFERVLGDLDALPGLPSFESLTASLAKNPDVARWADEMEAREAAVRAARSKRVPDLTVTLGLRATGLGARTQESWSAGAGSSAWSRGHADPDDAWEHSLVFDFAVPLPLFDRNQGGIKEAESEAARALEERRRADVGAHAALFAAFQELQRGQETVTALRDRVLPRAKDTYERTHEGYAQGKFGYLDVLDAQKTYFSVQQQYVEALTTCHQALAEVERLSGEALTADADSSGR